MLEVVSFGALLLLVLSSELFDHFFLVYHYFFSNLSGLVGEYIPLLFILWDPY